MQTKQLFPDVSFDRRPKVKEKKKLNLVQLFPDVSGKIRSESEYNRKSNKEKFLKPYFHKPTDRVENKNLKWFLVIITLSIMLLVYIKTFSIVI